MKQIRSLYYSQLLNKCNDTSRNVEVLLDFDAGAALVANAKSAKVVKNLVLAASLLVAAPVAYSQTNNSRVDEVNSPPPAALAMNENGAGVVADLTDTNLKVEYVNETPVVDINNPNESGVSDNRFKAFSTEKGVVFKNNSIEIDSTVLKQKIKANPNLLKEAKTIIAQVTGNNKSVIKGTLEVLGGKADVLVINPNGIDLNGVDFLNVKDFTASTGKLDENAQKLVVNGGEINVNGDFNTDDVNMIRLIAQAVNIKAKVARQTNKSGKKADIIVAGGKQSFDLNTNSATNLDNHSTDTTVAIKGSHLGSMYGNQVNFIVTDSGAGVEFDGIVVGEDNVVITADGKVRVNRVVSEKVVELTSSSSDVQVQAAKATNEDSLQSYAVGTQGLKVSAAQDLVVAANAHVGGKDVDLQAGNQVKVVGKVTAQDTLTVKVANAQQLQLDSQAKVKANTFNLDTQNQVLSTQADLDKLQQTLNQVEANQQGLVVDSVNIAQGTTFTAHNVTNFVVRNDFVNRGILNLAQKRVQDVTRVGTGNQTVISTGKTFANYGELVADNLQVSSLEEIKLDGATFVLNDARLVAPVISQNGTLQVVGNLDVHTDNFNVIGNIEGDTTVTSGKHNTTFAYYADHNLRRDHYEISADFGAVDLTNVAVKGGKVDVKGNFTLAGLSGEQVNGTTIVSLNGSNQKVRLDAVNAEIMVGGDFTIDGDVVNAVKALDVRVSDLMKANSSKIKISYQPRTWINTALMGVKTVTFNNMYDFFAEILQDDESLKTMDRFNGAYRIDERYVMDTFRASLKDSYSNQVMSTVFGADWRYASYETLQERWKDFQRNQDSVRLALYAPGGQILVGKNFEQNNGNLFVGTDESQIQEQKVERSVGKFQFVVNKAGLENQKIGNNYNAEDGLARLAENTNARTVAFEFVNLNGLKQFAEMQEAAGKELTADNLTLALSVIEQLKAKTGNFLFVNSSEAEVINKFIANRATYLQKVAELDAWLADKLRIASETGKKLYEKQYQDQLKRLNISYDMIVFKDVNGKLTPEVVLSKVTENKSKTLLSAAATIATQEDLTVNAGLKDIQSVNSLLRGDKVSLTAKDINLVANNKDNALEATTSTTVKASGNFNLTGSAELGDFTLEAQKATFKSKAQLDADGYQVQSGTANAKNASVTADKLEFTSFKFLATEDASFTAKDISLLSEKTITSTFDVQAVAGAVGTKTEAKVIYKAEGSELNAKNLTLNITDGDLNLSSSKLVGSETLKANVAGDLTNSADKTVTATNTKFEKISLSGTAGVALGGYEAGVNASLVNSEGKAKATPKLATDSKAKNGPYAGLSFSYTTSEENVVASTHENTDIQSRNAEIKVKDQAEIGNIDFNDNYTRDKGDMPTVTVEAARVTSNNGKDEMEREFHSSSFTMGVSASAGSKALDALGTTIASATTGTRETTVDPLLALQVVSNLEDLIIKPLGNVATSFKVGGEWENTKETASADSRNVYKGNLNIKSDSAIDLKAVDGQDLNNLTLKAETVNISSGEASHSIDSNRGKAGISADVNVNFAPTGPSIMVGGNLSVESSWTKGNSTRQQNSNINAKSVNIRSTDTHIISSNIVAEELNIATRILDLQSKQDFHDRTTTGFNFSAGGGVTFVGAGAVSPYGSANAGLNHHIDKEAAVATQASISASRDLKIKADQAVFKGSIINGTGAKTDVKIDLVQASSISNTKTTDGGSVSAGLGFSKDGISRYNVSGSRDDQYHFESKSNASVIGAKIIAEVNGDLNKDANKTSEVAVDKKVQGTTFNFAYSSAIKDKIKATGKQVVEKGKQIVNKVKPGTYKDPENPYNETSGEKPTEATTDKPAEATSETTTAENKPASDK